MARTHDSVISSLMALRISGRSRTSIATPEIGRSSRKWVNRLISDIPGTLLLLRSVVS